MVKVDKIVDPETGQETITIIRDNEPTQAEINELAQFLLENNSYYFEKAQEEAEELLSKGMKISAWDR